MKIIEDVLRNHFIPAIIGETSISEHLRELVALPIRVGGMAVTTPHLNTESEYSASKLLTKDIVDHMINQNTEYKPSNERVSEIKNNIKKGRTKAENTKPSRFRENMSKDQIRANYIRQQPGCNNWLNIIPIEEYNYNLNKQQFLDAVGLRYQLPNPNLPTQCPCGEKFDTQQTVSCKKGGFVTLHHNKLKGITGALLEEFCHDVAIKPILQPVTDSNLVPSTATKNYGARLDVNARSF